MNLYPVAESQSRKKTQAKIFKHEYDDILENIGSCHKFTCSEGSQILALGFVGCFHAKTAVQAKDWN